MAVNAALGGAVRRREDPRLVTGSGQYTDDVRPEGCLHAVFVRSPHAHARIDGIDDTVAAGMPGVAGIFTSATLGIGESAARRPLAEDAVRFAGEAVAVVVADTREQAVDAAAMVVVDYTPQPAMVRPLSAVLPDATLVHPDKGENVTFEFELGEAAERAPDEVTVQARVVNQRMAPVPLEGNAAVAVPEAGGALCLWTSTQVPFRVRTYVAAALGIDEAKVRVITPDVGGAFGGKLATYEEQAVIAAAARALGRPVRWFATRSENMTAMTHGRAQYQEVTLAARRDGKLAWLDADIVADSGAYAGIGATLPAFTAMMMSGAYEIPLIHVRTRSVFTNTTTTSAYRGAGRPEATALVERAMDMLAAELEIDPAELRRRNLVREFPYVTPVGAVYDSGDYVRALDTALEVAGYAAARDEQRARREAGATRLLGVGICCYVEMSAVQQTSEFGSVSIDSTGDVVVTVGTSSGGQGHETAFAQLAAALLDVPFERVTVVQSDTAHVARGDGTYGSRSMQLAGSAVHRACAEVVEAARTEAARLLEAEAADIERIAGGRFCVRGVPAKSLTWAELATSGPLRAEHEFEQDDQTFPSGCHVAVVEVDVETGDARLLRHVAVDDCGTVINSMLVEGQIHGGVAQGVGQALYEEFVYDDDGNPLTTSLIDYAVPTIGEIPAVETIQIETPTPRNPLGVKGAGESGTIGSTPAVQNAVIDALAHLGVRHIDMPLHPMRVWEAIQRATGA